MRDNNKASRQVMATIAAWMHEQQYVAWARVAKRLSMRFEAHNSVTFITMLYVHEEYELCLQLCQVLSSSAHNLDIVRWHAAQTALCFAWKLHILAGESTEAQKCIESVRAVYVEAWMVERAKKTNIFSLEARLAGAFLYNATEEDKAEFSYHWHQRDFYILRLPELLLIQALGRSDEWPMAILKKEILYTLNKIKALRIL